MDTEVDLTTVDRDVLIAIIAELQAVIERLERRIAELEGQAKPGGPPRMPGLKAKPGRKPPAQQGPRKQRRHGFARRRMTPTQRVEHAMDHCPDCGTQLSGGWTHRTREVIDLPQVPVEVTEHVYMARICPGCRRRCLPPTQLDGVVMGQQRLGVNLISLIATLREEARLPIGVIRKYLRIVHGLHVSKGAIVDAVHRTAQQGQAKVASILAQIRASPVVHADETGWGVRTDTTATCGLSAPPTRATSCGGVGAKPWWTRRWAILSPECWSAISTLPTTIMMAPNNGAGPTCCGTSTTCAPATLMTRHWHSGPMPSTNFTARAKACTHPQEASRRTAQLALERRLLALCQPFLLDASAQLGLGCRRIERHIKELFVFMAEPAVPSDNNAAERSLRHLVVSRKISGGTRSERGTDSKMTLASLFGTWRVQGLNPLTACRQLLRSPQL